MATDIPLLAADVRATQRSYAGKLTVATDSTIKPKTPYTRQHLTSIPPGSRLYQPGQPKRLRAELYLESLVKLKHVLGTLRAHRQPNPYARTIAFYPPPNLVHFYGLQTALKDTVRKVWDILYPKCVARVTSDDGMSTGGEQAIDSEEASVGKNGGHTSGHHSSSSSSSSSSGSSGESSSESDTDDLTVDSEAPTVVVSQADETSFADLPRSRDRLNLHRNPHARDLPDDLCTLAAHEVGHVVETLVDNMAATLDTK
ncbi:hypothetical protein IWQ60_008040 [Tieghemiomyces parasiticus]|uniref:Uncharacterized protein n=1 Tax=Tieghemiomyces parasiticus TaxID=78921 RepID=A0A9W7ZZJ3_9FUNG|nr:hypothetical protein IWQ60_008040 [Tieghemiomyces parasiticus]